MSTQSTSLPATLMQEPCNWRTSVEVDRTKQRPHSVEVRLVCIDFIKPTLQWMVVLPV